MTLIGDSMLARLNRTDEKGFKDLFQEFFSNIDLLDLSKGGTNILFGLEQVFNNEINPNSKVFTMFGTNDAASWKQVPIDIYENTYREVLNILVSKNLKVILITPPPVDVEKQTPPGRSNKELIRYANVVRRLSKEYNVGLIDLNEIIGNAMKDQDVHLDDGVHLNQRGNILLLEQMKSF
jgi:lysophospholipase L1-like esterase